MMFDQLLVTQSYIIDNLEFMHNVYFFFLKNWYSQINFQKGTSLYLAICTP